MIFLYMSHNFEASENLLLGEFVKKNENRAHTSGLKMKIRDLTWKKKKITQLSMFCT